MSHPFPLHPSAVDKTCLYNLLLKNCSPRFRVGEAKLDGYAQPALDRLIAVTRWMKTPVSYRFGSGAVERIVAGAAVDFHLFRMALIVDEHAQ
jgi:hypothetical protein